MSDVNVRIVNYLGEFSDSKLENDYLKLYFKKSLYYIKRIILVLAILNTLFIIPDYIFVNNINTFKIILVLRASFMLIILLLLFNIRKISSFKKMSFLITVCEILCVMLFIFIFYNYDKPDYMIQAFGVMVIISAIFIVPNRWINMIIVSVIIIAGFNVLSFYCVNHIDNVQFSSVIVYLIIILVLSGIMAYRDNYYKRMHYIDRIQLIKISVTDSLTGVYNRAKLNDEIQHLIEYSEKFETKFSFMIIDIDDFKKINDTFGHLIGDKVIVQFTNIIKENIREIDVLARWGGEEFALLLPDTNIKNAFDIAERLRQLTENFQFSKVKKVTCSFGISEFSSGDNLESLTRKADKMLYAAKKGGKNTIRPILK